MLRRDPFIAGGVTFRTPIVCALSLRRTKES